MFKNQLQELAQRSCFNLPSYACVREGPDHAPRFKASVNFNGEIFESPTYCPTLRQAEHAAAEVALNVLSSRGPSRSLTARVLDETGIYKNLLQETAHRAGLNLPVYTTVRSGPGHAPVFTCTVELAGMNFTGDPAKTKKQAEKNAAIAAWSALKRMPNLHSLVNKELSDQEQEQAIVSRVLSNFRSKDDCCSKQFRKRDQLHTRRKVVRGSCSSNTSTSSLQYPHWRLLDLLLDSASEAAATSSQKQNSFVSLLPPPPPRTTSKILPPIASSSWDIKNNSPSIQQSSVRHFPVHQVYRSKSSQQIKTQDHDQVPLPVLLEEHERDEEEWLGIKSDTKKPNTEKESPNQNPTSRPPFLTSSGRPFSSPSSGQIVRPVYCSGGFVSPSRLAPAVQIRSVIPVCAAPPAVRSAASASPSPSPITSNATSTKSTETATGEASMANNNTESSQQESVTSSSISSELNNKLQLL